MSMIIRYIDTRQKIIIVLLFWVVLVLNSCQDNNDVKILSSVTKDITLSIKVPGTSLPKTRTLSESNENEIKSIEVLLFNDDEEYVYQPLYSNTINTDPDDNTIKTFTISIPEGTYNMLIFANARQTIAEISNNIHEGDSKLSVLGKLIISNSGKWSVDTTSAGYISIPMFGEISSISVNTGLPINTPVSLVRMLSKIDIGLSSEATTKFTLESVRLYNYNNKGYIVPNPANWNQVESIVTDASVPVESTLTQGPLLYEGSSITSPYTTLSGEIYTFEAIKANPSSIENATCLVVGGTYSGDNQPTYYRIDFAQTSTSSNTYLPLLRNHYYKVNITKVNGRGVSTANEAFNSRSMNMEANIIMWDNAKIGDIVFDGQYMLGVSQREITFSRNSHTTFSTDNTFYVTTDYPVGWKIEKITDASDNVVSWLNIVSVGGNPISAGVSGSITELKFNMSENNNGLDRTAYIHFSAGRLTHKVQVKQKSQMNLELKITDMSGKEISELLFVSPADVQPIQQQFKLKWGPGIYSVRANRNDINNMGFSFDGSYDQPGSGLLSLITDPSGEKIITVRPKAITTAEFTADPFLEKVSVVDFRIGDVSTYLNSSIFLRHIRYNILIEQAPYYLMDGTQKYFTVKSNTDFTIEINSNPDNVIQSLVTTSGRSKTSGTKVYFNIINDVTNPTLYYRNIAFTIKSPQGHFADMNITLPCYAGVIQPKSNSYIIPPNGTGILIPVSRANDSAIGIQLGASDSFTADLLWTDNVNKIADNSNISFIHALGVGSSGYVLVKPGSVQGNAVVQIKNTSNKTLWSWHIWTTDYIPTPLGTGKFMDRNLGAIGNTPNTVGAKGLLYQWGRKDPFPGSTTLAGTNEPVLYTSVGTTSVTKVQVAELNNLANAITNPLTFYQGIPLSYDWYTNETVRNDGLWGPTTKTVYDPCPPGWRVPQHGIWGSNNFPMGQNGTSWNTNGMTWAGYGGWYPVGGYRTDATGNLTNTSGMYWTATPSGLYGFNLNFNSSNLYIGYPTYRAGGFSIRCVSEQ